MKVPNLKPSNSLKGGGNQVNTSTWKSNLSKVLDTAYIKYPKHETKSPA